MSPSLFRNTPWLMLGLSLWASTALADDWRKIDFDADLTTYLINVDHITHEGDLARVPELNVPGRTGIGTGGQSHTTFDRIFDCQHGTERLGEIRFFRALDDKGQVLSHEDRSFDVRRGSLDETMFNIACRSAGPSQASGYPSVTVAVQRAFMDAIKLPADQSVRNGHPFVPPGEPISGSK